jgi:adenylate kinase family enzyme
MRLPASGSPAGLGRRILVWGTTGSGKTTLASRLGERLCLPVIELDALFWQPAWQATPADQFRERVQEALDACPDGWVCDGNYNSRLGDLLSRQAETVIWLNLPFRVTFWRVFRRCVVRAWRRDLLWGTNRESWRLLFLDKDSLLLWAIRQRGSFESRTRQRMLALAATRRTLELRTSREVEALVGSTETARVQLVNQGVPSRLPPRQGR